jgi:hypothetical protein
MRLTYWLCTCVWVCVCVSVRLFVCVCVCVCVCQSTQESMTVALGSAEQAAQLDATKWSVVKLQDL